MEPGIQVQHTSLVEVRSAGDLGKGVFAVQDIARGTRIFSEAPLLVVQPASEPEVLKEHIEAFCAAVQALSVEGLKTLDNLSCNRDIPEKKQAQRMIHQWHEQHGDGRGHKLNTRKLRRADNLALTRFSIFVVNRMGMGHEATYGDGLFALYSRINHSCSPNVVCSYNPTIKRLTVHATRDIKTGDQLLTEYTIGTFRRRLWRRMALERWGIECQCKTCTDPEEEALRDRMINLDMDLFFYDERPNNPRENLEGSKEVPRTPTWAIEVNEKIAALLRHPTIDLQSIWLCKM